MTTKDIKTPSSWRESPIYKHVLFFCVPDGSGNITRESIIAGHKKLNLGTSWLPHGWTESLQVKAKADVILDVLRQQNLKPHIDSFYGFVNPARTAFWTPKGTFDEEQFEYFVRHFVHEKTEKLEDAKTLVTRDMLAAYLKDKWNKLSQDEQKDIAAVVSVWHGMRITSQTVTNGSLDDLFTVYHDRWMGEEKAFTIRHLRSCYARDSSFPENFVPPKKPCK